MITMKPLTLALLAFAFPTFLYSPAWAGEKVRTPKPGDPERTEILDAVRPAVEKMSGQPKIVFVVEQLLVCGGWAYLWGRPQTPDGSSQYEDVTALIRRDAAPGKGWRLVRMLGIEAGEVEDPEQAEKRQWAKLGKEFPDLPPALVDAVLADER